MGKKLASLLSRLVVKKKQFHLRDKSGKVIIIRVYSIDKISTDVKYISVKGVLHLFNDIKEFDIQRPTGEIDVLVGHEYAGFHPVREQS